MIAAHHQFEILMKTLQILDDCCVDFYIHIDKKCKSFPQKEILNACQKSKVYLTDRISVEWGGYSQIECTLLLLSEAIKGNYDYYHYISGVDLPIKSKKEILDYFVGNPKKQFIHFERVSVQKKYVDRLRYHSFFQDSGNCKLQKIDKGIRFLEKTFGIDRTKNNKDIEFQYGANWFSITHDFAEYVLGKKTWISKTFKNTRCGDELFIQTIVVNSPFREQLTEIAFDDDYMSSLRFVDWKRGKPYVFRMKDYNELVNSPFLFARKFDLETDANIVDAIYKHCMVF